MHAVDATSAHHSFPLSTAAAANAGLGALRHVTTTGSTNEDLSDEARRGSVASAVLVADHQSAGRGRLDRRWEADPETALLVSFRLSADGSAAPVVVAAVAAAARHVTNALGPQVGLKWPNDLLVGSGPSPGKLAGVLAEFVAGAKSVVVVGIGINVSASPPGPDSTSLAECGAGSSRDDLLAALIPVVERYLGDADLVAEQHRLHSATLGRAVRVEFAGGRTLVGDAIDLGVDGRLIVRDLAGDVHEVVAGDVVHLRTDPSL